ncbi:transcriptional regulator [Prosthecochloris marina]|uniref:Transcriptional regulator n=2 Tax=Prosthecochloris marina TaxID=2017681 RepID=A0A317T7V7_9CHLB|nr:transcriptional regulator [Prosthecochloris marina]
MQYRKFNESYHFYKPMSTCSFSGLTVTEKPHWYANHSKRGYITRFSLIDSGIIHGEVVADHDVTMDYIDIDVFQTVIRESNLAGEAILMLFGLKRVKGVSFAYKKNLINLLYNLGPTFKLLVIYNVDQEIRSIMETFAAIAPEESTVLIANNYNEAMQLILDTKSGKLEPKINESNEEQQQYIAHKKEFLSALARFNWLNLLDHPITLPESTSPLYPYFKALEAFQQDLREKEVLHLQELKKVSDEYKKKIAEKTILINAQEDLNKKTKSQHEHEKASLIRQIVSKDMALKRISSVIAKKRSKIKMILDLVEQMDIEPAMKQKTVNFCQDLIDYYNQNDKKNDKEISIADSAFITMLERKNPELSKKDLRVCLLIKQNHSTSEIAHTIGITTRGVESMRYRLHKKLGLKKNESIKNYLLKIAGN